MSPNRPENRACRWDPFRNLVYPIDDPRLPAAHDGAQIRLRVLSFGEHVAEKEMQSRASAGD